MIEAYIPILQYSDEVKATKHLYCCSRDADTTFLGFGHSTASRSLDDKRLDSLFILIFFAFCARTSPVYQDGIVSIPGAKDLTKRPVHGMDDPTAAKQIRGENCGSSFHRATQPGWVIAAGITASILSVYSDAASVSRERVLSYAHDELLQKQWPGDAPRGKRGGSTTQRVIQFGCVPFSWCGPGIRPRNTPARFTL